MESFVNRIEAKEKGRNSAQFFFSSKIERTLGIPPRIEKYERKDGGQQALDDSPTDLSEINSVNEFRIDSNARVAG